MTAVEAPTTSPLSPPVTPAAVPTLEAGQPVASPATSTRVADPPQNSWLRRLERIASHCFFALAALMAGFLIFVLFLSGLAAGRAQSGLERRFERPVTDGRAPVGGVIRPGTPVARLDIAGIGLHQIVVEGTASAQLQHGPGHVPVSPMPGQVGNSVIAAHRLAFGGAFSRLGSLRVGSDVSVLTGQGHFTYVVASRGVVPATDVAPFQATSDNRLTFVTASNWSASRRLVVVAELEGKAKPFPPGRPRVLAAADGGLVGGPINVDGLVFWVAALGLAVAATVTVYRHLPRWSGYIATTPVLLLTLWVGYAHLAQLLPATL